MNITTSIAARTFITFIGLVLLGTLALVPYYYTTGDIVTVRVTDKQITTEGTGESVISTYMFYTDLVDSKGNAIGTEVFKNEDDLFKGKFNSSDYYAVVKRDSTYKFHVLGWRIPLFSTYRNVIKIE